MQADLLALQLEADPAGVGRQEAGQLPQVRDTGLKQPQQHLRVVVEGGQARRFGQCPARSLQQRAGAAEVGDQVRRRGALGPALEAVVEEGHLQGRGVGVRVGRHERREALEQLRRAQGQRLKQQGEPGHRPPLVVEPVAGRGEVGRRRHVCGAERGRGQHGVGGLRQVLEAEAGRRVLQSRARQHRQREDVHVVGREAEGEVQAGVEALERVAGQPVDEVEAIGGPGLVQQQHLGLEVLRVDGPADAAQHGIIGALQADLEGAAQRGEELGQLLVDELAPQLEEEVDGRGLGGDEAEDGLGLALVEVEGGIQHEDLADAAGLKVPQLRLHAVHGHAPGARGAPGLEAEVAAEGTAPGELPEHSRIGRGIQGAIQVGRGQAAQVLHQPGADAAPHRVQGLAPQEGAHYGDQELLAFARQDQVQPPFRQQARRIR